MIVLNVCQDYAVLTVIYIIKLVISILSFVVPVILIVIIMIDLVKSLANLKEESLDFHKITIRVIAAIAVFLIPTFVNGAITLVSGINLINSDCWTNANATMINTLRTNYEEIKAEKETLNSSWNEYMQNVSQNDSNSSYNPGNNTESGITASKTYYDESSNTFVIPNTRAKSDSEIPKYTQNNLGVHPVFYERLMSLINDAKAEGYNIIVTTGYRSYSSQLSLWNGSSRPCDERSKWVSCPGGSRHGFGIAADLRFDGEKCSEAEYDCNDAAEWVHNNASKYDLKFRLSNEPWHIEPKNVEGGNFGACDKSC